jgi:hypothetical protein
MVYVNIPYVPENDRVDREITARELQILNIDEDAKQEAFAAIYNKRPRGVDFTDPQQAFRLQETLQRLGVPYRESPESEYKYEEVKE